MSSVRSFVFVNMAMTTDGKIATANRRVSSFGSARDLAQLYELRATADAVMCGARTLDAHAVSLGPGPAKYRRRRLKHGLAEYNLRVIVTGAGSIDSAAAIFNKRFSPIIVLTTARAGKTRLARLRKLADDVKICGKTKIDFAMALAWLWKKWGVKRLLVEGGGELNGALFAAGLVDELHLTICPLLFGGRAAPSIADGVGASTLAAAKRLPWVKRRQIGPELFLIYKLLP